MNEPSEAQEPFTGADVMKEHALALGLLCIYWASLDRALDLLLESYLDVDEKIVACVSTSAPDVSARCEMLKRLSYLNGPDGEWRDCLIRLLNRVQGELAAERNRYVHDDWNLSSAGAMIRIDRRAKVIKPQARQPAQLVHVFERVTPVAKVDDLTQRVVDVMTALAFMSVSYGIWASGTRILGPPLQALEASNYNPQAPSPRPSPAK